MTVILLSFSEKDDSSAELDGIVNKIRGSVLEKRSKLFIVGEAHYIEEFMDFKYRLYKKFYTNGDVKLFVEERALALQPFYDHFWKTRDTVFLKSVFDTLDLGFPSRTAIMKEYDFVKKISGLPGLQLACVDVFCSNRLLFQSLQFVLAARGKKVSAILNKSLAEKRYLKKLEVLYRDSSSLYSLLNGRDREMVRELFFCIGLKLKDAEAGPYEREQYFKRKITWLYGRSKQKVLVGQFGSFHADLSTVRKGVPMRKEPVGSFCSELYHDSGSVFFHNVSTLLLDFDSLNQTDAWGKPMLANNYPFFNSGVQGLYSFKGNYNYQNTEALYKGDSSFFNYMLIYKRANSMVTRRDLDSISQEAMQGKGMSFGD